MSNVIANYRLNKEHNGIEIIFNSKPSDDVLKKLRNNFWRWHKIKKCWYNKHTEYTENFAKSICSNIKTESNVNVNDEYTVNEHGVKIGDIFYTSWGYDQTNVDFYQVISVTAKSAKVREIASKIEEGSEEFMSANVLPIKDNFTSDSIITTRTNKSYNGKENILKNADGKNHVGFAFIGKPIYCSWGA